MSDKDSWFQNPDDKKSVESNPFTPKDILNDENKLESQKTILEDFNPVSEFSNTLSRRNNRINKKK